jgi:hypothetical protein
MKPIAVFAASVLVVIPLPAFAAPGGLLPGDMQKLKSVRSFAVVPSEPPAGFTRHHVESDPSGRWYRVTYSGPRGATITIAGALYQGGAAQATSAPSKPHGLFQSIAGAFNRMTHQTQDVKTAMHSSDTNANKKSGKSGEEEEEMTAVAADSQLVGPVFFQPSSNCLKGDSDPSKAQLRNARFTVKGCALHGPDSLIHAYRSLVKVF